MDELKKQAITQAISRAYKRMQDFQCTDPDYADDYITQAGIIEWTVGDDDLEEDVTAEEVKEVIESLIASHKVALIPQDPLFYMVVES